MSEVPKLRLNSNFQLTVSEFQCCFADDTEVSAVKQYASLSEAACIIPDNIIMHALKTYGGVEV